MPKYSSIYYYYCLLLWPYYSNYWKIICRFVKCHMGLVVHVLLYEGWSYCFKLYWCLQSQRGLYCINKTLLMLQVSRVRVNWSAPQVSVIPIMNLPQALFCKDMLFPWWNFMLIKTCVQWAYCRKFNGGFVVKLTSMAKLGINAFGKNNVKICNDYGAVFREYYCS